jgi:general stress protein 26
MITEAREWVDGKWKSMQIHETLVEQAKGIALRLTSEAKVVVFSTIADRRPQMKAMYPVLQNGLLELWFNTDSTSKRLEQIKQNPLASIYVYDTQRIQGVMLSGRAVVETDAKIRLQAWEKAAVTDYKCGVADPDFQVIRFSTDEINCFFSGNSVMFRV